MSNWTLFYQNPLKPFQPRSSASATPDNRVAREIFNQFTISNLEVCGPVTIAILILFSISILNIITLRDLNFYFSGATKSSSIFQSLFVSQSVWDRRHLTSSPFLSIYNGIQPIADLVPSRMNQYRPILTQYHQVPGWHILW